MKKIISLCLAFILIGGFTMARGTPDGGESLSSSSVSQVFDPGENTTRLLMGGGSNSRSGRWYWATGFESGLSEFGKSATLVPSSSYVFLNTAIAHMGKASLQITPPVGIGQNASFIKSVFSPIDLTAPSDRFGEECMVSFSSFLAGNDFDFQWGWGAPIRDIGRRSGFRIVLKVTGANAGNLYYIDAAGVNVLMGDVGKYLIDSAEVFHYSKLVADVNTNEYVRFYFDNIVFDLSGIPGPSLASTQQYFQHIFTVTNRDAAAAPVVLIDNVVLTADEP